MEKILILGLNNSISSLLIEKNSTYGEFDLFFTQSKNKEQLINGNIFYFNFLENYGTSNPLMNEELLSSFSKLVIIASYYGDSSEEIGIEDNGLVNQYLVNIESLILSFIKHRKKNSRVIFLGSIASEDHRKSSYPFYKLFKLGLKNMNTMINLYYNKNLISSTYINLGSFSSDIEENNIQKVNTKEVVDLLIYLLKIPLNVKINNVDFKPLSE